VNQILPDMEVPSVNETSGAGTPQEMVSSRNDTSSGPDSTGKLQLFSLCWRLCIELDFPLMTVPLHMICMHFSITAQYFEKVLISFGYLKFKLSFFMLISYTVIRRE
jgi:hypothetical protein